MAEIAKSEVLSFCKKYLDEKIQELKTEIKKIKEDAANETKSSMGDKYETGREMMMQERRKLAEQLENLLKQKVALEIIDDKPHDVIKNGSLVQTNQGLFLFATALGALSIKGTQIFVISQSAPLAKEMLGKRRGDSFLFNKKEQAVVDVS